jgi:hypothetical protein
MITQNPMLQGLQNNTNYATTDNGALVRESTNSLVLDFFSKGGALRGQDSIARDMFDSAYSENPLLAVKAMFYFRDARGGQGERQTFRVQLQHLANIAPETVIKNLSLISEYGRWDDILCLLDTKVKGSVVSLIKNQLISDISNMKSEQSISLLAKWLPSENASSKYTSVKARELSRAMKFGTKQYRHMLSTLRAELKIIESIISKRKWSAVDYQRVPSNAMMLYRNAFKRHDEVRFQDYIAKVESGEAKINAGVLYPYEIVQKCTGYGSDGAVLNAQWNALPDYANAIEENAIAVVDVSGSMTSGSSNVIPMDVAVSLGLYLAEHATGAFKDAFITFSESPQLQTVSGTNIVQKVRNMKNSNWGYNTNLEKVFDLILKVGVSKKLKPSEMLDKLYIISDMQFDQAVNDDANKMLFDHIREKFARHGYTMPNLVFWNVYATAGNSPMSLDDRGFQNVSGFSPSILTYLMTNEFKDAYGLMLDVLESDRYSKVVL